MVSVRENYPFLGVVTLISEHPMLGGKLAQQLRKRVSGLLPRFSRFVIDLDSVFSAEHRASVSIGFLFDDVHCVGGSVALVNVRLGLLGGAWRSLSDRPAASRLSAASLEG